MVTKSAKIRSHVTAPWEIVVTVDGHIVAIIRCESYTVQDSEIIDDRPLHLITCKHEKYNSYLWVHEYQES